MACPSCGATGPREPISPGYWCRRQLNTDHGAARPKPDQISVAVDNWECRATIDVGGLGNEPAPGRPWTMVAVPWPDLRTCGCRYQEEAGDLSSREVCVDGTFAIGVCVDCGILVCGDCSRLLGRKRRCLPHDSETREQARIERREAEAKTARELDAWVTTPVDLDDDIAFELLFLAGKDQLDLQKLTSAHRIGEPYPHAHRGPRVRVRGRRRRGPDPEPRIFAGFPKHIRPQYARGAHTHGHARGGSVLRWSRGEHRVPRLTKADHPATAPPPPPGGSRTVATPTTWPRRARFSIACRLTLLPYTPIERVAR
jgi:hypothetical protein